MSTHLQSPEQIVLDKQFLTETLAEALDNIHADTQPQWGSFIAQEMIEHLADATRKSTLKTWDPAREPKEEQQRFKQQFFYSDTPMMKNMPNPLFKDGKPALIHPDITAAKQDLQQAVSEMMAKCEANPTVEYFHFYAGNMSYQDLLRFHVKHFSHHLSQFGAL
ncbi:hypothetical protein [Eisenibacter elegans]|jgi:oxepin-CoA hydrolase/3-oxo-5,6-dehydrosuberyl-CoA semialdehyde dehydrogenase|uniref:hypothetical protein n=1 Tax=Eisenibacter elegans TaxID=997 RepID=UPI0004261AB9|nr:hypothetical protein [Eisenibacter elegans]